MTPGERKHDEDLVRSARQAAAVISKRSRKFAQLINTLADRVAALSTARPIINADPAINTPNAEKPIQPASTPEHRRGSDGESIRSR